MLKKILLGFLAVVVIFLAIVATRPATFEVKRSLQMSAPPDVVYAQVADFHAWKAWSPWAKLDPAQKETYEGPASGVGAKLHWEGNKDVGTGEMTITDAKPGEHLGLDLHFMVPFEAKNRTDFDFAKGGEGTMVTWTMSGKNDYFGKAMSLFMDMDKMVGPDFEKGLIGMKDVSEKVAAELVAAKKAAEAAAAAPAPEAAPGDAGTP
jgi:hypothetical protein